MKTRDRKIDWNDIQHRLRASQQSCEGASKKDALQLRDIFRQRAAQLTARRKQGTPDLATSSVLVFLIGTERYGLELAVVAEVMPLVHCTPVPEAPPELLGVINVRGDIHSLLDLGSLLGISAESSRGSGYVVLVRQADLYFGLRVEQIHDVELIALTALKIIDASQATAFGTCVRGISPSQVIVLDAMELISRANAPSLAGDAC